MARYCDKIGNMRGEEMGIYHFVKGISRALAAALACAVMLGLSGCGRESAAEEEESVHTALSRDTLRAAGITAYAQDVQSALDLLDAVGFAAADEAGRLDFAGAEFVHAFFAAQEVGENGRVTVMRVCADGALIGMCIYNDGEEWRCAVAQTPRAGTEITFTADYALERLMLTEKDYLIYTCAIPDNTAASKHDGYIEPTVMLRLAPHDAACDATCAAYIAPIGYNHNNLFTTTWTAPDMGAVELRDAFLSLWHAANGAYISYFDNPYPVQEGTMLSLVPRAEFEAVIMRYLPLTSDGIARMARLDTAEDAYAVTIDGIPNGAKVPVPEVTAVRENPDGTLTLTVDAVFIEYAADRAFTHVVTLRPGEDGAFTLLSNELIEDEGNILPEYESAFD